MRREKKRTFIDSGVLIAAARGQPDISEHAMAILGDPDREFASSQFVKLEVLPKAIFFRHQAEVEFYEEFFQSVIYFADFSDRIVEEAFQLASRFGLSAMDALHIAAARSVQATELITTEKPGRAIHRVALIQVISLQPRR